MQSYGCPTTLNQTPKESNQKHKESNQKHKESTMAEEEAARAFLDLQENGSVSGAAASSSAMCSPCVFD